MIGFVAWYEGRQASGQRPAAPCPSRTHPQGDPNQNINQRSSCTALRSRQGDCPLVAESPKICVGQQGES